MVIGWFSIFFECNVYSIAVLCAQLVAKSFLILNVTYFSCAPPVFCFYFGCCAHVLCSSPFPLHVCCCGGYGFFLVYLSNYIYDCAHGTFLSVSNLILLDNQFFQSMQFYKIVRLMFVCVCVLHRKKFHCISQVCLCISNGNRGYT